MLARPTLTRPVQDDASKPKPQARPTEERFLLRVDGQIKRSFSSKEDAATAGAVIKKAYPHRGGYRCRYEGAHHRDHQSLGGLFSAAFLHAILQEAGHVRAPVCTCRPQTHEPCRLASTLGSRPNICPFTGYRACCDKARTRRQTAVTGLGATE